MKKYFTHIRTLQLIYQYWNLFYRCYMLSYMTGFENHRVERESPNLLWQRATPVIVG